MKSKSLRNICHLWLGLLGAAIILSQVQVAFGQVGSAKYDPSKKFEATQLRQDFLLLRRALEEAHPGLYHYSDKTMIEAAFVTASNSLNKQMTEREFYGIVTSLLSSVKDGHTKNLPSEACVDYLSTKAKLFPLKLRFLKQRAYVVAGPDNRVPRGSELLSINGRTIEYLVAEIFGHLVADGDIKTGKYWELNDRFALYYYLFIAQTETFRISYRDQFNLLRQSSVSAITDTEAKRLANPLSDSADDKKPLRLSFLAETDTALLTIKSFSANEIEDANEDYPKFLENCFRELEAKKIRQLVIDLRGNDGGRDSYGSLLFSYLTDQPFRYYDHLETSTDKISFLQYTNATATFNKMFDGYAVPLGNRRFRVNDNRHPNLSLQQPQANHFSGRIWFLVNGQCFSTTAEFCSIAHYHRRGTFVGEEVGGNYFGNTSGTFLLLTLPNTGIRILIPLVSYALAVSGYPYQRRGLMPDYNVQPTIQDVLKRTDTELNFTLSLIHSGPSRLNH
jgi:hypothetical protein